MTGFKKNVIESDFSEYFRDIDNGDIYLLDKSVAEDIWDKRIHKGSSSYFRLPDDCWLHTGKGSKVGRWVEAYNADTTEVVRSNLANQVSWGESEPVYFFLSRKIAFELSWGVFLGYWDSFLAIEDDCPFVIPKNIEALEAFIFTPIGDVFLVGNNRPD